MWSWVFHRVSGVGILLFLFAHILDTLLVAWGPEVYNRVMAVYRRPVFRVGEVGLAGAVLFHALNGLRIILIDFVPPLTVYQNRLFWAVVVLFLLLMAPAATLMLHPLFLHP